MVEAKAVCQAACQVAASPVLAVLLQAVVMKAQPSKKLTKPLLRSSSGCSSTLIDDTRIRMAALRRFRIIHGSIGIA
jgi:hypothetical protein